MNSAASSPRAFKLATRAVEKVWGRDALPPPFAAPPGQRIGEIWFEPPAEMDSLLLKFLFTSEKLSVQVHPSDRQARDGENGKEECWLVLDTEPGATLAIGFDEIIEPARMAAAARDGSIEGLLTWHEVRPGDFLYLPAGTVHAIGPGITLVEVQQNSDTTFRLYDYGRPRTLHLERAMDVAQPCPYPAHFRKQVARSGPTLVDGPHFRLDRIEGVPDASTRSVYEGSLLALPLEGELAAVDGLSVVPGECLYAEALGALDFSKARVTLLTRPA